jgi:hypothetical protein
MIGFVNKVLKELSVRKEIGWREPHSEELRNFYSSANWSIMAVIKSSSVL